MSVPSGLIVIDKPRGPTSHDVVARLRFLLGTKKVGHAGTLDPMATGVLVVAFGQGTKLVPYLTAEDKRYSTTIELGRETDSLDADGVTTREMPVPLLTQDLVDDAVKKFVGTHLQQVPRVSAVKVGGERLHKKARRGDEFTPPSREVTLHTCEARLEAEHADAVRIYATLHAQKGFYVRSFARDLAESLGTVGHLSALRRTQSGAFTIDQAVPLSARNIGREREKNTERDACEREAIDRAVISMEDAAKILFTEVRLSDNDAVHVRNGRPITSEKNATPSAQHLALFHEGVLLAIGQDDGKRIRVRRGFF